MLRFVRRALIGAIALALLLRRPGPSPIQSGPGVEANVVAQIDAGQFAPQRADRPVLAQPAVDAKLREALEFQRERMRRILLTSR